MSLRQIKAPIELYDFPGFDNKGFLTFCTGRSGGVSSPPFDTLNTNRWSADKPEHVEENLERIKKTLKILSLVTAKQVHGDDILFASGDQPFDKVEADSIVTDVAGVAVAVRTADCAPVLIADPAGKVAAVHAGRAGVEKGIVTKTVEFMKERLDSEPFSIEVAIGPLIRSCCYEVDQKSAEHFYKVCGGKISRHIDLVETIFRQLAGVGVDKDRITDSGICTACSTGRFYSYRKEGGKTGRFLTGIMINEE